MRAARRSAATERHVTGAERRSANAEQRSARAERRAARAERRSSGTSLQNGGWEGVSFVFARVPTEPTSRATKHVPSAQHSLPAKKRTKSCSEQPCWNVEFPGPVRGRTPKGNGGGQGNFLNGS